MVTFTTLSAKKKMFEQKRFKGRHLLTFESQKLNYFGKKSGAGVLTLQCNSYLSHVRSFFKIPSNFLSLISSYPLLKMQLFDLNARIQQLT